MGDPTRHLRRRLARTGSAVAATLAVVAATPGVAAGDFGIDVSRWQHSAPLNWAAVKADGVSFAFLKATEGTGYTNPYYAGDRAATRRLGIYRGAYHYARPSPGSAVAQARYFVSRAGRASAPGDLPPVLDLEATGGLSVPALRGWTATWLRTVEQLTGRTPMIYTSPSFWETATGDSTAFTRYPLWIAHWRTSRPRVPGGWPRWTFWQTSNAGHVNGIRGHVDIDVFSGSRSQLAALANVRGRAVTRVDLRATRDLVRRGSPVRLRGHLTTGAGRPVYGKRVHLYRRVGGSSTWRRVAAAVTRGPGASYSMTVRPRRAGSYRTAFHGAPRYRADFSNPVPIRIR